MLSAFLVIPLIGAIVSALLPAEQARNARVVALVFSGIACALSVVIFFGFDPNTEGYQFVQRFDWISEDVTGFAIQYTVGVDGISAPMVILLGILTVVAVLVSWNIDVKPKQYFAWLLFLETAVAGVFISLDLIQFFLFWELELLPMFMLISQWGSGRRLYSATKFLVYTLAGSAFMLLGFLVIGFQAGTFDMAELAENPVTDAVIPLGIVFWAITLAFLVKLPVFPVHTWLP
ncbi:MAG: NADH-quinone oxidoreductase subunit M, partial [Dehalococcoidia bacterium]|nr:NADH-quinone oxidoreductase subunit M [Dehalococcoidia bacterium]